jgi:hypothetical protein
MGGRAETRLRRSGFADRSGGGVGSLRQEYTEAAGRATHGLAENPFASVRDGRLQLKRPNALEIPERTRQLREAIETGLPRVRVEELLQEVDRHVVLPANCGRSEVMNHACRISTIAN